MKSMAHATVWMWAMRDLLRRPGDSLLTAAVIWLLIVLVGTAVLLPFAVSTTAIRLLDNTPSIVVRRVESGGWTPIPVHDAVAAAYRVKGVTGVRPRLWGVVRAADGPVTVVAWDPETRENFSQGKLPDPGEALAAEGIAVSTGGESIVLRGRMDLSLKVTGRFASPTDIAVARLLLLHPDDARRLLGLGPEHASDLALTVFHDSEADAMLTELSAAFPWPVRLTTRREAAKRYAAGFARSGGLTMAAAVPCFFAMVLLVTVTVRERLGKKRECGLLKALGWTTGDIVRVQVVRSLVILLPAMALGWISAWAAVFFPGISWPGRLLFGWDTPPPALYLDSTGAFFPLAIVTMAVAVPYAAAVFFPVLKSAAAHPADLMEEEWTI